MTAADRGLVANTELLMAELPDPRLVDSAYLQWLYRGNPLGHAIERAADESPETGGDPVRVAHYAIIPQRYRNADGPVDVAFSLHAVSRTGSQRAGHFQRLGLEIYAEGAERGWPFVIGVTNLKSTPAVVKYMGWRLHGPLPVKLCPAVLPKPRSVTHQRVTRALLDSNDFDLLAAGLDRHPAAHWTNCYTADYLRWRLATPHTDYWVHTTDKLFAVSTRTVQSGVPAAVILKLLPRDGRSGPLPADRLVSAIARHHRVPVAVYAGWNAHVTVRGVQPPRRLLPAPLNLVLRHLDPEFDQDAIELDTYEFLDMDAY